MLRASFYTLGCKLNQLETESFAAAFQREGFEIVPWDRTEGGGGAPLSAREILLVVNTCTVTSHAEQKARHVIRKALRDHPAGLVLVTGCYAQMEAEALEALSSEEELSSRAGESSRVFVIPGERKDSILDLPSFLKQNLFLAQNLFFEDNYEGNSFLQYDDCSGPPRGVTLRELVAQWAAAKSGGLEGSFRFRPGDFSFHSRAFLKIQDGCDKRCAYCRVSIARGKSRSGGAQEILSALRALEERGYREAVLTGVNISQYSGSAGEGRAGSLPELLEYLLSGTEKIRLRLSSLESEAFVPDFFRVVSNERIRPHFHISAQSGSPRVLERMGRPRSLNLIEEAMGRLREIRDDPFLACDIIAGFPGETEEDFEQTYAFCEKHGFAWIHAFPFSRRPGTAAWNFKDRVSEREARVRVGRLTELARAGRKEYIRRWIGKETEFVPDSLAEKNEYSGGVTSNYLKVFLPGKEPLPPDGIIRCGILDPAGEKASWFSGGEKFDIERLGEKFDAAAEIIP